MTKKKCNKYHYGFALHKQDILHHFLGSGEHKGTLVLWLVHFHLVRLLSFLTLRIMMTVHVTRQETIKRIMRMMA